jgi:histidinol-phosphate aminotransferase
MLMNVQIRKEVLSLNPYPAGKPISEVKREYGLDEIIKLASNENPLGCSPRAMEAASKMSGKLNLYPDASVYELKSAIAGRWGVEPGQIFCGTGTDLLLRVICMTVLNSGDESIMGEVTFSRYDDAVKLMGGKPVHVPMKNHALDAEAMVNAITPCTKIIWFCNPNNPTGTMLTRKEIEGALEGIPENILIVMDEAYYEYVTSPEYPDSLSYLKDYPNLVVLRTFSKAYGLAGLRVGYGI